MKKKRSSRRAPIEPEIAGDEEMEVDSKPITPRVRDLDVNFVDDDDLQAALARSRKAKLYKAKKLTPEELARRSLLSLLLMHSCTDHGFHNRQATRWRRCSSDG